MRVNEACDILGKNSVMCPSEVFLDIGRTEMKVIERIEDSICIRDSSLCNVCWKKVFQYLTRKPKIVKEEQNGAS